jgi:hypothetical protein
MKRTQNHRLKTRGRFVSQQATQAVAAGEARVAAAEQAALDASPESLRQDVAEAQAKAAEVRNKKRLCGTKTVKNG